MAFEGQRYRIGIATRGFRGGAGPSGYRGNGTGRSGIDAGQERAATAAG